MIGDLEFPRNICLIYAMFWHAIPDVWKFGVQLILGNYVFRDSRGSGMEVVKLQQSHIVSSAIRTSGTGLGF